MVRIKLQFILKKKKHVSRKCGPGLLATDRHGLSDGQHDQGDDHHQDLGERHQHHNKRAHPRAENPARAQILGWLERHGPRRILHSIRHIHKPLEERGADPLRLLLRDERAHHENRGVHHVVLPPGHSVPGGVQYNQDREHGGHGQAA